MPSAGRLVLTPNDAVHNSAPSTPTDTAAARRGRTSERRDVATNPRAKSTRTPTPTFATAKRKKVPEPTKSPEVLNTEIAAELNAKAQDFVENKFGGFRSHPQHKNVVRACTPILIDEQRIDTNCPILTRTRLEKLQTDTANFFSFLKGQWFMKDSPNVKWFDMQTYGQTMIDKCFDMLNPMGRDPGGRCEEMMKTYTSNYQTPPEVKEAERFMNKK